MVIMMNLFINIAIHAGKNIFHMAILNMNCNYNYGILINPNVI